MWAGRCTAPEMGRRVEANSLHVVVFHTDRAEICASGKGGIGTYLGLWEVPQLPDWETRITSHLGPLMPTPYPGRPWQKCGADLFMLGSKTYLLVVDYASRYVEIALLTPTRSDDVIQHLKSIFARHGICETLVTDNGPQFSGAAFAEFAESYGFQHVTSSPKYPQGNVEAERAVQTVKGFLKKSKDPYLALLVYRATPLQNGYSPAQLLMGRRLRTTVPILPALLYSAFPNGDIVLLKEREKRMKYAQHYNLRHRTKNLNSLTPIILLITDLRLKTERQYLI
ncbi:hypothetical protein D5F01_LYC15408 [Larimichthys crocea]|uniref:Integrase catalytic domain-containing protein n=1 Tax=Larimichthys crocea TaxID=215358 RepID=A0A6G0I389_LARCR|nr:hypothetical protein D5F01_LYC15408 [Larimichthys crocea]